MVGKWSKISLNALSSHYFLRFDPKNLYVKLNSFEKYYFLKDIFQIINGNSYTEYYSENKTDIPYIRIGDLSYLGEIETQNMVYLEDDCPIPKDKIIKQNDLILATIGATVGKINIANNFIGGTFSNNTVLLRLKEKAPFNIIFLEKILQSKMLQKLIWSAVSQKAQPNLQDYDLKMIKISNVAINIQNKIVEKIEPLSREISKLKKIKKQAVEIINEVFAEELNFDWTEFERLKNQKIFKAKFNEFSENIDCRYSYKFHNEAGKFVYKFLCSITNKRIKNFISQPIVLGKGVSPSDYDEDGDYYYIAMSNIKTWAFDPEDCKKVNNEYSAQNLNKTVQKDDIILARSGEGTIGKVAIIEDEDIQGIFADFTQRIRLQNYNPHLAYYYFRSDLFQYLVYTHKKGLGNNTNIFPSQIQEFPIPDWRIEKQNEITEKIKTQINAQKLIDKQIELKQNAISDLIENAIKNN